MAPVVFGPVLQGCLDACVVHLRLLRNEILLRNFGCIVNLQRRRIFLYAKAEQRRLEFGLAGGYHGILKRELHAVDIVPLGFCPGKQALRLGLQHVGFTAELLHELRVALAFDFKFSVKALEGVRECLRVKILFFCKMQELEDFIGKFVNG